MLLQIQLPVNSLARQHRLAQGLDPGHPSGIAGSSSALLGGTEPALAVVALWDSNSGWKSSLTVSFPLPSANSIESKF